MLHPIVRYKMLSGFDGFMNKWIAGWIGAWPGSPVLGHWGPSVNHVYVIPALLSAFIGAFAVTSMARGIQGGHDQIATKSYCAA